MFGQTSPGATATSASSPERQAARIRIHEHVEREEKLSNASTSDITETEEHITVHAKREPLPWSLRGASYDKPLPGIGMPSVPGASDKDEKKEQKEPPSPTISPVQRQAKKTVFGFEAMQAPSASPKNLTLMASPRVKKSPSPLGNIPAVPLQEQHNAPESAQIATGLSKLFFPFNVFVYPDSRRLSFWTA